MFTPGRIVFVILFVVAFILALIFSYRKDASWQKIHYKNSFLILVGFILFVALLYLIKISLYK